MAEPLYKPGLPEFCASASSTLGVASFSPPESYQRKIKETSIGKARLFSIYISVNVRSVPMGCLCVRGGRVDGTMEIMIRLKHIERRGHFLGGRGYTMGINAESPDGHSRR